MNWWPNLLNLLRMLKNLLRTDAASSRIRGLNQALKAAPSHHGTSFGVTRRIKIGISSEIHESIHQIRARFFVSPLMVPILKDSQPNKIEEPDDVEVIDDDFTTRRLSSAATCLVAGIEYTHGQQINRIDPCEFCLCLDGEMFCWWQDCPPALDGPCKDQGPFSQCDNIVATKASTSQQGTLTITNDITSSENHNETKFKKVSDTHDSNNIPETRNISSISKSVIISKSSEEIATVTVVTSLSKFCVVMGIRYKIGDKLPHNTGNCVECICGEGAKISCSPHQCTPLGEEMNDYRPPEPRLSNVDNF